MKTLLLTTTILSLLVASPSFADQVCSVHDGDTFTTCTGQKVRVWGVDAPELIQPMGIESREHLKQITRGREVKLDCVGKSYKRSVCHVEIITSNGPIDASREMAGSGLAYDSPRYSHGQYHDAEGFAQSLGRGVWSLPGGGVRPWDFRHHRQF